MITKESTIYEILTFLRKSPSYNINTVNQYEKHPFHKRYHAKPMIFHSNHVPIAFLTKFKLGDKEVEQLEIQDNGLTNECYVFIGPKQFKFKTVIEAEALIADYLSE